LAGTGIGISSGDGGPVVRAGLDEPAGIAVAVDGTLYVSELDGRRIRRVDPSGTISTIAR
jgi:streptogramin lyase